ncbi:MULTISPECIES: LysR family transcriptional regulator [unclassified Burkholderia]|uniref:LysR family transcriptional regulator n=1 Tax=unclassified Burkholderia TaxID=2613784 RepID=UPI001422B4A5|nr:MULTISPECIES: LysR family transcriptional regulator [unclassified Burkholderia]NIE82730.1 LysR family transcriptional regulator [Burkholderia sp. Tr-860]NIF62900.1 LysR family transcriptional regulator [Burkholderia sp. Cy-647]NIF69379.1 LysR family transcriptional regulator [Burkholderia sp. Ap-962]NIF86913.1 LysR family transcriptional regulator [Burkholderia sp. Cy-637]NIF93838.1 LysR family transcriptional regulator [Burkholderia sp. Ax-1720]
MQKENWDDLRVVLAAFRGESVSEAARLLNVNESTVLRRIAQLEERLGSRLFNRIQGKLAATDDGLGFAELAERIEVEIEGTMGSIGGADGRVAGTVRVTGVPIMVNRILIPALPGLLKSHPDLLVELVAEPRSLSMTKREADVAIRLARPRDELRIIAKKIGELPFAVYARDDGQAAPLSWVSYDDRMNDLPQAEWIAHAVMQRNEPVCQLKVNDAEALLASVQAGIGKTLLPRAVGDAMPGLRRLDDHPCDLSREIWILVHPDLRRLNRIRAVIDWAAETCRAADSA